MGPSVRATRPGHGPFSNRAPGRSVGDGILQWNLVITLIVSLLPVAGAGASATLSLADAEQLALVDDPTVAARRARSEALTESAIADRQLPDPKLKLGVFNVPLDSFDFEEQPTTQLRLGLQQAFPRGNTLRYKQRQTDSRASAEEARSEDAVQRVIRGVRERFLEVYYQVSARRIVDENRGLFAQLVDITESHYASGRVSQQDVLRAQLELSRLDDRSTRIHNSEEINRAALAKWIGAPATRPLDDQFPELPAIPDEPAIAAALERHPLILVETARLAAATEGVHIAQEQYKPGWSVGVEYRKRFGEDPDGSDRSDMMAAMVTMDLPLFPEKRQDRRLVASQRQADAAVYARSDRMRELRESLEREYASWRRLGERQRLYETQLLREAAANAEASISAYQSGVTEFTTLMRARITELDVRLDSLRIRVDRAKTQARLLYLFQGEGQ